MFPDEKTKWLNIRHAAWPVGLAVAIAAGIIGAGFFGPLQDKLVDKRMAAYDKTHSTNIRLNYLIEDEAGTFDDYCSVDRKKLAAVEREELEIVATIRDTSKREAIGYTVAFPVIILVGYVLIIIYFKPARGRTTRTPGL